MLKFAEGRSSRASQRGLLDEGSVNPPSICEHQGLVPSKYTSFIVRDGQSRGGRRSGSQTPHAQKGKIQNRRVGISTHVQETTCLGALFSLAFSFTPLTVWAPEKRCVVSQVGETTARAFRRDPRAGAILDAIDTSCEHMQALFLVVLDLGTSVG